MVVRGFNCDNFEEINNDWIDALAYSQTYRLIQLYLTSHCVKYANLFTFFRSVFPCLQRELRICDLNLYNLSVYGKKWTRNKSLH